MRHTTLRGNNTALAEGIVEQLEVGLLEQGLSRTLGVGRVSDDDVEGVLVVVEELEAVADVNLNLGVLEASSHLGQVLLGEADDGLVDVAEDGLLDALVFDDLAEDAAVAATNDEHLLGVGVRVHGQVGDHLLVRELVPLCALDDVVQDQDIAVVGRLKDQDVLVLALLMVQHLLDPKGHGLAWMCVSECRESMTTGSGGFTHRATSLRSHGTSHL
jgi:hypothetical protein